MKIQGSGAWPLAADVHDWRRNLSHFSLFFQISSVSSDELVLPRLVRCELSRLCYHQSQPSLVLLPMQDKMEG